MSVSYATFNGVLVYENRGGVETEYTSDTLGNLIECHGPDGVSTYTADYWPYGEVRTSTGTNPSNWGFVGLLGYYTDALNFLYVRARYYRPNLTRWQTVDPLWPRQLAYAYSKAEPVKYSDPSGLDPCGGCNTTRQCMISCLSSDFLPILLAGLAACVLIAGWVCAALFTICLAAFIAACSTVVLCIAAFLLFLACLLPCDAFVVCVIAAAAAAVGAYCVCLNHCGDGGNKNTNTGLG